MKLNKPLLNQTIEICRKSQTYRYEDFISLTSLFIRKEQKNYDDLYKDLDNHNQRSNICFCSDSHIPNDPNKYSGFYRKTTLKRLKTKIKKYLLKTQVNTTKIQKLITPTIHTKLINPNLPSFKLLLYLNFPNSQIGVFKMIINQTIYYYFIRKLVKVFITPI